MKPFATLISMLIFASATSAAPLYACKEKVGEHQNLRKTLIIESPSGKRLKDGEAGMLVLSLTDSWGKRYFQDLKVRAELEDVQLTFENSQAGVQGTIFLDELDTAYLTLSGVEILMDCR